ncbi:uncharacterized protein MONOS_11977 [Monocercomonoides exilis]|uniref:uncharacterized protein n=1 Tax=Monocercomonoides exilis TaxID=2049356 RepID=UPI003559AD1D|nr:hypothetical protein MONOS_11977 [Monocercomonoides exilis]|eukprot:MONOS_11977.1-p1 / transcript=MONOS_11977.1 / gene=MONOS_11977 / organism=Monocercomonoides_exilis_PA203 / gene_product=unspecified product / transcript_product=unspecified product / location=Mono_scaffold00632:32096-33437(-) / protein_length=243 / sequence_SO=supercontig / SO=protein_coding / is_pseudo=false
MCVGLTIHFNPWPLSDNFKAGVIEFFDYLNFAVCWRSSIFVLVMTCICIVVILVGVIVFIIAAIFRRSEKANLRFVYQFLNLYSSLLVYLFHLPIVNTFVGNILCYGTGTNYGVSCNGPERLPMMILSILFLIVHLVMAFVIRLFIFTYNMKDGDIFCCQTGLYQTFMLVVTTAFTIITPLLHGSPIIVPVVGRTSTHSATPSGAAAGLWPVGCSSWASSAKSQTLQPPGRLCSSGKGAPSE